MANSPLLIPSFTSSSTNAINQETRALETQALQLTQPRQPVQTQQLYNPIAMGLVQPVSTMTQFNTVGSFFPPPLPPGKSYKFAITSASAGSNTSSRQGGSQKNFG